MGLGLLLLLPWGALANIGGGAGACRCSQRWPHAAPPQLQPQELAPRVRHWGPCPGHVWRFELPPRLWLCGLQNAPWVMELLGLLEQREAQRSRLVTGPTTTTGPPASPTTGPPASPTTTVGPPTSPSASPTEPHASLGRSEWEAMEQAPQVLPPGGPGTLAVGLVVGLVLLGAGLGLAGVLACRSRGPSPPALPPHGCPIDVGQGPCCPTDVEPCHSRCKLLAHGGCPTD